MSATHSIGRFSVRKAVRFSIKKLYSRAECFDDWLSADETRAAAAALERARQEKAERRAKVEEGQRLAALRNPPPDFSAPIFQTGQFRLKVEYKTSDNVPHAVECRADSRDEMYQKAKSVRVRPSRVTQLDFQ